MLLENKVAVVFGGSGEVGRAIALGFAREGAVVYLAGRTLTKLEATAEQIRQAGGKAVIGQMDAMDPRSIEQFLAGVVKEAGHLDVTFNAISTDDVQGIPLTEIAFEQFMAPIDLGMRTQFYTATAAARIMQKQGSGVIMTISAVSGKTAYANSGGFAISCIGIETFCRQLANEVGPSGVRVICLRSAGSLDASGLQEVFTLHAKNAGMTYDEFVQQAVKDIPLRKLPALKEIANVAAFMASERASALTGTAVNISCGQTPD